MSHLINERFTPAPPWLTGNLQTLADRIRPRTHVLSAVGTEERILVDLGDETGDHLAVRVHRPRLDPDPTRPLVLVVHGMGGTIDSTYVRATTYGLLRAGCMVARVDLRGAGDSVLHTTQLYHGGRTEDLRAVLRRLAELDGHDGLAMVGFSLGGNVTLKLLGEGLGGLPLRAGVSVSAPLDLSVGVEHLSRRMFGMYERFLVHRLKVDTAQSGMVLTAHEEAGLRELRTIVEFDTLITAQRNGWRDAAEYYAVNSSAQFLPAITVPTLVVHAVDDPMITIDGYLAVDWDGLADRTPVRRAITRTGGHVGFHEKGQPLPWYVGRIVAHLDGLPA